MTLQHDSCQGDKETLSTGSFAPRSTPRRPTKTRTLTYPQATHNRTAYDIRKHRNRIVAHSDTNLDLYI